MKEIGRIHRKLWRVAQDFTVEALAAGDFQQEIERALAGCGRLRQRVSPLQPMLMMWVTLGMTLFRYDSIPAVLARLLSGLRDRVRGLPLVPVGDDALSHARKRLGVEPVRALFRRTAECIQPEPSFHGYRTWAIDGLQLTMPDAPRNATVFGRPVASRGQTAFPQLRTVSLQDTAARRFRDVRLGLIRTGERELARPLLSHMGEGDLVHLDRGFYGLEFLREIRRRGAEFLVRVPSHVKLKAVLGTRKQDGDYLAWISARIPLEPGEQSISGWPSTTKVVRMLVRVLEYRFRGFERVRLAVSVKDRSIPAMDWILQFHERWEAEIGFDEVETHQTSHAGGALETVFRSKTPRGVIQEAYALFTSYNLVRQTMAVAATAHRIDPDAISFVGTLRAITHMLPRMRAAQPEQLPFLYQQLLDDIASQRLERPRRKRRCPRVVRVKMSKFPLKRSHHHPAFFDLHKEIRIGA